MKTSVEKIYKFLNSKFPFKKAEDWDNVGHSYGKIKQPVSNVVVALDLTPDVFETAIVNKASLIITHHPFIFNEDINKDFAEAPYKKEIHDRLISTGISLISLHTNYDVNKIGTSLQVAKALKLESIHVDNKYGAMFKNPITLPALTEALVKINVQVKDSNITADQKFKKWAIIPGSGSPEDIINLKNEGADLIVTSDIKWSTWQMARVENITLVEIPHVIEDVFTHHITKLLRRNFKGTKIIKKNLISI